MRFAIHANDHLTRELVKALDDDRDFYAATWRAVGKAAERAGLRRRGARPPGRGRLREARPGRRRGGFLLSTRVVDTPLALERLRDAKRDERLVTQRHKAPSAVREEADGDG